MEYHNFYRGGSVGSRRWEVRCGLTRRHFGYYLATNSAGVVLLVGYVYCLIALFKEDFVFASDWWNVGFSVLATLFVSFFVGKGLWHHVSRRTRL